VLYHLLFNRLTLGGIKTATTIGSSKFYAPQSTLAIQLGM